MSQSAHPSRGFLMANLSVGLGTLLCRVTGFGRILALAYAIGLGGLSDVYNTANTTPNIIYELMLGGILSATLLPSFVRYLKDNDHQAISAILSVTTILLGALTLIMVLAAPLVMDMYSITRQENVYQFHAVGVHLVQLFMPQIFFYGLVSMATALLNAQHKFALPAYVPILNNLVVIGILLALPSLFGAVTLDTASQSIPLILYLGVGTTLGIAISAMALIPAVLKSGLRLSFSPDWTHPAVKGVLRLSGWTFGYVAANQIALFLVSLLALRTEGWMTAYQTAFAFFVLPHGLLAMTITTTFLPKIAHDAASTDMVGFRSKMMQGLELLALLMLPASVGYMMIAKPLLVALLAHGQFTVAAAHLTGDTLSMFALGLLPFSAYLFLLRGFYALSDTKTPFQLNCVENLINIALAVPFVMMWGVAGLALSYSLSYCAAAALTFMTLRRRVGGGMGSTKTLHYLAQISLATALMALVVAIVLYCTTGMSVIVQVVTSVGLGAVVYATIIVAWKVVNVRALLRRS